MLHRGIKFVHVAVLAFSAVLAFLFVRGLDEDGVLGNSALVWVFDSDDSVSGAQVAQAIASFSDDRGVTVAREVPDMRDPDSHRHLYLAPDNRQSGAGAWLDEGYPAFSRNYTTDVHPIAEIGQRDPRGQYYVFGSPAAADALVAELTDLGLRASVSHPLSYTTLAAAYTGGVLYWSFWVVALAAVTMTGASVLLSTKAYGVLRLQGLSFADLLVRDLRQLAVSWSVAAGAVAAGTLAFLGFYNGLAWLGLFATVAAGLAGLFVLLVLAAHAAVLALTFKVDVLRALKGELPARAASISVYLVRIPALLLALGIAMDVAAAGQDVLARQESREAYAEAGDAVTIRLNGSLPSEMDQVIKEVGPWLRRADGEGKIILAGRRDLQSLAPDSQLPPGEVLVVNETFLAEQRVLNPTGRRYTPVAQDGKAPETHPVRLIVPESLGRQTAAITAAIPEVLASSFDRHTQLETLQAKNGQRVFAYNPGNQVYNAAHSPKEDRSLVRDPVLVVVPNGSKFLSDDGYTAFATQEGVVFPDPDDVLSAIETNGLQTYVTAVRPVGQNSALKLRDAVNELRVQLFNFLLAVTVLLIAGVGVCIIYSRKNAQAIFVQHISGWRYTATHRFILSVEVALAVLLATRMPFETWLQNQELEKLAAAGVPLPHPLVHLTELDLSIIAVLVAVEFGAVLLALAAFHGRIVREGATEA
ncbi:bacteriocin-associated integral membrane family protein [Streptomyces sp. NPDC002845]